MGKKEEKLRTERANDIRKTARTGKKQKNINKNKLKRNLLILLVVAIMIFVVITVLKNMKMKIEPEQNLSYNYFTISVKDKIGIIDKTGKIIINPEYDDIQIPNPGQDVFLCIYNYNASNQTYNSKVLNKNGEEIYKNYNNIQAIKISNASNNWGYQTNVLKYKKDNKYGLITINGKKITNPIYDAIDSVDYKDGVLKYEKSNKYGIIKLNGEKVLEAKYDAITSDGYYSDTDKYSNAGYIVSIKKEDGYKYGYISSDGKEILETKYNSVKRLNEITDDKNTQYLLTYLNGQLGLNKGSQNIIKNEYDSLDYDKTNKIISLEKKGKYGVYDLYGNMILPIQYDDISFSGIIITAHKDEKEMAFDANGSIKKDFEYTSIIPTQNNNYYVSIDNSGKYGIVNQTMDLLVGNKYSYIGYAFDNYFIDTKDTGKSGIIDNTGKEILTNNYDVVQTINGTNIIQAINSSEGKTTIYNKKMERILETKNAHIYLEKEYVEIISENQIIYTDFNGNVKKASEVLTQNNIFASYKDGKWGYVDKNGKVVVDYKYEMATDINEYGYGAIKLNGKWGSIDSNGKIIKEPIYTLTDERPNFIGEYYKTNEYNQTILYSNDTK